MVTLTTNQSQVVPLIISRDRHPISRANIDKNALKVLYRLHRSGYKAYLVGGSVRDLILGRKPKDFDVATDARPNKIKKLFRNSFLIGKRFRLAHIKFKTGIVEVSTFRKESPLQDTDGADAGQPSRTQNTFGSPSEDAFRRDFTINALFYNIGNFSIIDYTGGLNDLKCGIVRAIGDPEDRFIDDPVRMLRAIRAAARVGFAIDAATYRAIVVRHNLITTASPPRVYEEMLVLLKMGTSNVAFKFLHETSLLRSLFPDVAVLLDKADQHQRQMFFHLLSALDRMTATEGEQSPQILWGTVFMACLQLLYPETHSFLGHSGRTDWALQETFRIMNEIGLHYSIPRKHRSIIKAVLQDFPYMLSPKTGSRKFRRFPQRSHFQDALRLLTLFCQTSGKMYIVNKWKYSRRK